MKPNAHLNRSGIRVIPPLKYVHRCVQLGRRGAASPSGAAETAVHPGEEGALPRCIFRNLLGHCGSSGTCSDVAAAVKGASFER